MPWIPRRLSALLLAAPLALALTACGGSGSTEPSDPAPSGPVPPTGFTVGYDVKAYNFSWNASPNASRYELFEDPDGATGSQPAAQIGGALTTTAYAHSLTSQLLHERVNAIYRVRACDASGCGAFTAALLPNLTKAIGQIQPNHTGLSARWGSSVALSADGSTLAVGATGDDSGATGINGDPANAAASDSGAVMVFVRSGGGWTQQAYIKASNTASQTSFGFSVALSADGNTLAVGSIGERGGATGINGDQTDTSKPGSSGAAYVFTRNNSQWNQQAYVKPSNTGVAQSLGWSVALAADGNTLAVSAVGESSNATGIHGDQTNSMMPTAGAVYVFSRFANTWNQQAYVKASNTEQTPEYVTTPGFINVIANAQQFGTSLALSADGNTLAVGALGERSAATGINGNQTDRSANKAGAVYLFTRSSSVWSQQAYVKASNTDANDFFGYRLALSGDGATLAVGAQGEASKATGIQGVQSDNSAQGAGAAYVYTRGGVGWNQQAYIKASNTDTGDVFGNALALSFDGNTLAVGAPQEASSATGINGNQADNTVWQAGAAYIYRRDGSTWNQRAYVKPVSTNMSLAFGRTLALSADGHTLAVGADSQFDGALYLY
ncbi:FG-GAP repeat protein [Acidovorax radicis]|uniref:FG-GAP repeat protein n=1 Tax=Acidovorax radicis TaxID=758826 RepID=UPI0002DDDA22|nr:FG-GAP repeat protein [Acidovorax radicis]